MFNSTNNTYNNKKHGHVNLSDVFLDSKTSSNEFCNYLNSPPHRRRSNGAQQPLTSKFGGSVGGSKSVYIPQANVSLPPPPPSSSSASRSQQTRSPQLSVMGYRSDMFTVHSKPLLPVTKSFRTNISSNNTASTHSLMKNMVGKTHHGYRWKTKPSNVARVNNYPDPMYNADSAFLQRITEMAGLEVETMKLEKWKKPKRK